MARRCRALEAGPLVGIYECGAKERSEHKKRARCRRSTEADIADTDGACDAQPEALCAAMRRCDDGRHGDERRRAATGDMVTSGGNAPI